MKDLNVFTCTCFCCADPELKTTNNGVEYCRSRVGVNGFKDGEVSWFGVKIFGAGADVFAKYVKKGSQIALSGELRIEENNDRLYPTIYINDFRFIGGGKRQEEAETEGGMETETVPPTNDTEGIADDDIPF